MKATTVTLSQLAEHVARMAEEGLAFWCASAPPEFSDILHSPVLQKVRERPPAPQEVPNVS